MAPWVTPYRQALLAWYSVGGRTLWVVRQSSHGLCFAIHAADEAAAICWPVLPLWFRLPHRTCLRMHHAPHTFKYKELLTQATQLHILQRFASGSGEWCCKRAADGNAGAGSWLRRFSVHRTLEARRAPHRRPARVPWTRRKTSSAKESGFGRLQHQGPTHQHASFREAQRR